MKFSDCDARQKRAWTNIMKAASFHIFGLVNTCQDYKPGDEDYDTAKAELFDLDNLISTVYSEATTTVYLSCGYHSGPQAEKVIRDIRFCGKEFLMKVATYYCKKYQKEAFHDLGWE